MHTDAKELAHLNCELWIMDYESFNLGLTAHRPQEWRLNPLIVDCFSVCKILSAPN